MKQVCILLFLLFFSIKKTYAQKEYVDSLQHQLLMAKDDTTKIKLLYSISFNYAFSYQDTAVAYGKKV